MNNLLDAILGKKKFPRLISKDWLSRIISLILAVVLWYYVGGEDRVNKTVMVPIEIINLPRDLVISNQFKKEIEVTVSGPRSVILEMANKAHARQVDLAMASPGTMVIQNGIEDIPIPRGIGVQRVQPSSIILSLDKLVQKEFPVSARTVGVVADGYHLKSLRIDPEYISITGPQTALSQFDELYTKTINLIDMKKSAQLQVPLELEPAIVELIGETSVTADLNIQMDMVIETVDNIKVHFIVEGVEREVVPDSVTVKATFPKALLEEGRRPADFLSAKALGKEGSRELVVVVQAVDGDTYPIEILSVNPSRVDLVEPSEQGSGLEVEQGMRYKVPESDISSLIPRSKVKDVNPSGEDSEQTLHLKRDRAKIKIGQE